VDDHFYETVAIFALLFLPINTPNYFIMHQIDQFCDELPDLQDYILLTLHWRWMSEWGRKLVASSSTSNGVHYSIYECREPIATQIVQDACPTIIDAPWTLIFRMG